MTEGGSFYGKPTARGRRRDGLTALVVIVVVVGVGLAIAKPWGGTPTSPGIVAVSPPATPTPSAATPAPAPPSYLPHPLPAAFTVPRQPPSSPWTGLEWYRLAPDDPLSAVRSMAGSARSGIAIGDVAGTVSTTVWSSSDDGLQWDPIPTAKDTSFWSGVTILGVTTLRGRFVAVTEMDDYTTRYVPPITSWTSADGIAWRPDATLPVTSFASPTGSPPLVAAGPNGLVIATSGLAARLATSADGSHWAIQLRNAFPAGFALVDLQGTASGYVAIGSVTTANGPSVAASLWSADGRHWPKKGTILPVPSAGSHALADAAMYLQVGDRGVITVGIGGSPGAALWWHSSDGRHWQELPTFPPLGATTCGGANCGLQPKGALIGDGHRLVALRGGTDAAAWVSSDGRAWTPLQQIGSLPDADANQATLLPGGVLVTDGITTWYGQAVGG
jgi:hypothetical protein